MMKNTLLICLVLVSPALLAQGMGPVRGDAGHGALLYYQHGCYECHGYSGYGRQDLNHTGSGILINEEVFRAFLRGRQDVAPPAAIHKYAQLPPKCAER